MELFPAIDIKEGNCVRLKQGNFDAVTIYHSDPFEMGTRFAAAGAKWLHIVDLDGARHGESRQLELIQRMVENLPLKIEVGGGIRDQATIEQLLSAGAERVIIGSLAVKNPDLIKEWLKHFGGERLVLAFDVKVSENSDPIVLTEGWQNGSHQSLWDLLDLYADHGLQTLLCTDVSRDGMLGGANNELYAEIAERHRDIDVLASGGIGDLNDLLQLAEAGLKGAVVGKAIYEGKVDLKEALKALLAVSGDKDAG